MSETHIGPTLVVDGEISGSDDLLVRGLVRGTVRVPASVLLAEGGLVEGTIEASVVDVSGIMKGDVTARERCRIQPGGKMLGDIRSQRILISDGALFRGKVEMDVPGTD
ncbi:MAG: polymer-forming cytoskeletal protein [Deltaproteobacteria bacterium]|nr:polymer-forming cytoskeletal protein [Deltaproteobacteria bacterium]